MPKFLPHILIFLSFFLASAFKQKPQEFLPERNKATQYTLFEDKKELKKLLVILPKDKNRKLITAEISNKFRIANTNVGFDDSVVKYIPIKETIDNWNKVIILEEISPQKWVRARKAAILSGAEKSKMNSLKEYDNTPYIEAVSLGRLLHNQFYESDKDKMRLSYSVVSNGQFFTSEKTQNFEEMLKTSDDAMVLADFAEKPTINPNQRLFLIARIIKSDIGMWMLQFKVKYNEKWSSDKINDLKNEATATISNFQYIDRNPIDDLENIASSNGVKNFKIESLLLNNK